MAVLGFSTLARTQDPPKPRIELQPSSETRVGDPIEIRIVGLPPEQEVILFSEVVDRQGRLWLGESTFRSTAEGVVDPSRQEPVEAAWEGVDPRGPFWALKLKTQADAHPRPADGNAERISFSVIVDGRPIATTSTLRWYRSPEVTELPVETPDLVGRLFVGRGDDRRPAVIIMPGSGGGIPAGSAEHLATHGYAALALAYFGEPGLPKDLELIPLEYFDRAIDWLKSHPRVDPERIALLGTSKGGELVLLLGTRRSDLRAVVAAVPASVVFQSVATGWPRTSSWSVDGKALPFVPYVISARFKESGRLSLLYEDSLDNAEAVARATIPVEKAACPILLISGRDDRVWPATQMCEQVVDQLKKESFAHRVVHLAYDAVGHRALSSGYRPVRWSPRLGGTPQGHAAAHADAFVKMLEFLETSLRSN